jgi:TPR repeat protein
MKTFMTKYIAIILLTVSILPFGTPAFADFQTGWDAYDSGDYATALKEWKPLAEQGDERAQVSLGLMYAGGQGVILDNKEAVKWFKLSADQGVAPAQYSLGLMYYKGHGVQDYVRAHMWWNIAASQGEEGAAENRDIVAMVMTPADISKAQDLARDCVAKNYKDC